MHIQLHQLMRNPSPAHQRQTGRTNGNLVPFGNSFAMKPLQMIMDPINNSRLFELFVSDFLGMTFPRTAIETRKRGVDMGWETFLREIVGGLTPVYVCGWLGSLAAFGLERQAYNPKKMGFRAWIDSNLLDHFANITQEVLPKAKTVYELKKNIVSTVISQIQSTDGIHQLPQFRDYFPENGLLNDKLQHKVVGQLTRYQPRGFLPSVTLNKKQVLEQAKFIESLAKQLTEKGAMTHKVALMHPDGFPYMNVGPREMTDILGKTKNYLEEFVSRALGPMGNKPEQVLTELTKKNFLCKLLNESGKSWLAKTFVPRIADGAIPYMYKLKRVLVGGPLLATALFAFSFARINNWLTSRKFGGEVFFPGERISDDPIKRQQHSHRPERALSA